MKLESTLKILIVLALSFTLISFSGCGSDNKYDMSSLNNDMDDESDFEEYISKAKNSASNESFSQANSYLEKARILGVSSSELSSAKSYVAQKKEAYEERIERERQARLERERQERMAREDLVRKGQENKQRQDSFCYSLSSSSAREACLGNAYSTNNENAKNIILGNCYAIKGSNDTAMTQVCVNGKQGCYSFNNSDVMNACVQCGGSNRWLRTYAAGSLFNCY